MWFRLVIILVGIVFMINGCNSLISQNFGTHKLRVLDFNEVVAEGLGDADFVELNEAEIAETYIVGPRLNANGKDYHLHPILTETQLEAYERGETVRPKVVGWFKIPYPACVDNGDCMADPNAIRGLVADPGDDQNPVHEWADKRIELPEDVVYLQLWETPLEWYWNLLMFLGGIGVAIGVEAYYQQKQKAR